MNKYHEIKSFIPNHIYPIIPAKKNKYYRNSITVTLGKVLTEELISEKVEEIYRQINDWIKFNSKLPLSIWHNLKIRQNDKDQLLLNFEFINLNSLDKTDLLSFLTASFPQIHSIYFTSNNKCEHVYGDDYLKLEIDHITVSIYPTNFCQINTSMISTIYQTIVSFCLNYPGKNIISLGDDSGNLCCYLASHFRSSSILGVLHTFASYQAALTNLSLNSLPPNLSFILNPFLWSSITDHDDTILIINPGRKGLRTAGLLAINSLSHISHIIYMSCKISTLKSDLGRLTNFQPIITQPIDNFPLIPDYCENVVLFCRDSVPCHP